MRDSETIDQLAVGVKDPVILQCPLLSTVPLHLDIQWHFNGVALPPGGREGAVVSEDQRRLMIPSATEAHAGEYRCEAENAAGQAQKQFIVEVMGKEMIREG